ncbi:PEP-CTERM sorting domain-containing protein [Nitrosovibrio sp. Nv4]|uniref:PEP-CTERM sorting domain-containing protein n=1 Tax=Nitrosovibrio sp. Nv4 TaxID=1945880 RepID=UPI000BDCD469|nr:PEP-CTERM sorting domain-containing protein [Nitrosovibrio sp. Nv4]SOD40453.1 MYXO-CTERM domain-containing protein [Nitrosovibrio sp. Nv4]
MKMNFKIKALALAAIMAASAPAIAAIDGGATGNGELLLNVRYYGGTSATTGGDDISGLFDLGMAMNDMLATNGQAGFSQTWDLTGGAYGASWNQLMSFVTPANAHLVEFNVVALDNTDLSAAGGARYLTTGNKDAWPSQGNTNVKLFSMMEPYINANNGRGTHATDANGASVATPTDPSNTFFGAINGFGQGDTWLTKTTVDTTQPLGTEQNFWFLTTSSTSNLAQATKTPFGFDLNQDGSISGDEFSKFKLSENGILTFTNPSVSPIPEADTWAMLLAGLGMLGMMVRRRAGV